MIRVTGLQVAFGRGAQRVRAVRGLSFNVAEGESFGLVGESGSDKSTVLRALCGLNPTWTGQIEIAGMPQSARRDKAFHKLVQMVFQDPYGSLHPRHTVDRTLSEPLRIHRLASAEDRVVEALTDISPGRQHKPLVDLIIVEQCLRDL